MDIKKFGLYKFLFENDKYFFRLEHYLFYIPSFFILVPLNIINQIIEQINIDQTFQNVFSAITITITWNYMLFILIILPIILTFNNMTKKFIYFLINLRNKERDPSDLDILLKDEIGHKIFEEFASSEFSIENISIYDDILEYNQEKDNIKRQYLATLIFFKYLNGNDSLNLLKVSNKFNLTS